MCHIPLLELLSKLFLMCLQKNNIKLVINIVNLLLIHLIVVLNSRQRSIDECTSFTPDYSYISIVIIINTIGYSLQLLIFIEKIVYTKHNLLSA